MTHKYFKFCFDAVQINDKIRPNEQKRILNKIRTCILKSSIAKRKGRDKYNELLTFLKNVEKADTKLSFDGIISIDEISRPNWVSPDDLDDECPQLSINTDDSVSRELAALSNFVAPVFHTGRKIFIQERYFSPRKPRFRETFGAYLEKINEAGHHDLSIEYHLVNDASVNIEEYAEECSEFLTRYLYNKFSVNFFLWREEHGRQRFHARHIFSEKAGIRVDSGTDRSDRNADDQTYLNIMSDDNISRTLEELNERSSPFSLYGKITLYPSGETKIIDKNEAS